MASVGHGVDQGRCAAHGVTAREHVRQRCLAGMGIGLKRHRVGQKAGLHPLPDGHDERIRVQCEGLIRGNGAGTPAVGIGDQPHPAAAQAGNAASIGKDFLRGAQFHDANAFIQCGFDFFDVSGHFLGGCGGRRWSRCRLPPQVVWRPGRSPLRNSPPR